MLVVLGHRCEWRRRKERNPSYDQVLIIDILASKCGV